MTMTYDKRNRDNLAKLGDHTKVAAMKWYNFLLANNIDVLIYETIRTVAKQKENVAKGASQTMKSYHIVGQALDFVMVVNGQTDWNGYNSALCKKVVAEAKRLGFEWGGDWKSFKDSPHLQFNHKGYGTDTFGKINVDTYAVANVENSPSQPKLEGWVKKADKWFYYGKTGWLAYKNSWYWIEDNNQMALGWKLINNIWYYLDPTQEGKLRTYWFKDSKDRWFYANEKGEMQVGWLDYKGKKYYLAANGEMVTGFYSIDGQWKFFNESGEMAQDIDVAVKSVKVNSDGSIEKIIK